MKVQILSLFMLWNFLSSATIAEPRKISKGIVRVGVIAPLTGPAAELGIQIKNGIEMAKKSFASRIELIYEDEACDAKTALTAQKKLLAIDKVSVIIGPLCSPPFLAVSRELNHAGIVFIHTSSGTQNTSSNKGKFGIEGTGTVMEENQYLVRHVFGMGYRRAAIIHFEQEWATGHAGAFETAFKALGGQVVSRQSFTNPMEADFKSLLLSVRRANPDAIFIGAWNGQMGTILKQMRSLGMMTPVFGQYDIEDPEFLKVAGRSAEGVQYTYPFDNENFSERAKRFKTDYVATYKTEPSFYPFNGFDIAMLVDSAISKCGNDSRCVHESFISTRNYPGVTGLLSFSEDGDVSRSFIIKEIREHKFVKLN